jgi:hypothetical protein
MGAGEGLSQRKTMPKRRGDDGRNDREQVLDGEIRDGDLLLRHHARDAVLCDGFHDVEETRKKKSMEVRGPVC